MQELLNDNVASKVIPQFSADEAFNFFHSTYQSTALTFTRPAWMPCSQPPSVEFDIEEIYPSEVEAVIKHAKATSSPSPFDQISYKVLKQCPDLKDALVDLFNACCLSKAVPQG